MPRQRRWTDEEFIQAAKNNESIAGVLRTLGLVASGSNYKTVRRYAMKFGLSTSHWTGQGHLKGKTHNWTKRRSLSEILVRDSDYVSTVSLKKRLLKAGMFENKCSECGQGAEWKGKSLVMVLDHINGDNIDHRRNNLRLLCPNCNSQQDTFAGRNRRSPYDAAFRREVLAKAAVTSVAATARELRIAPLTIRNWREQEAAAD